MENWQNGLSSLQKDVINATVFSATNMAFLKFDGRNAFKAVVSGEIKGFKPSEKIVNPKTYQMGEMLDIKPDVTPETTKERLAFLLQNLELCEQFRPYWKPENSKLASDWALIASS